MIIYGSTMDASICPPRLVQYWFKAKNAANAPVLQLKLYHDLLALRHHFLGAVDAMLIHLQNQLYFVCEVMSLHALASTFG